jgi:hypothetical protein
MADILTDKYLQISYAGKDLLEASGFPKASFPFKQLIAKFESNGNMEYEKELDTFAYFVYGDEKRARYFTDQIKGLIREG